MVIYLAGPLFTAAERSFNAALKPLLEADGHEVLLPQDLKQDKMKAKEVFRADLAMLDRAKVVVANMDGADPDSGTCWECGYFFARKTLGEQRFIIVYRTDLRWIHDVDHEGKPVKGRDASHYNLMLTESADDNLDLPLASLAETAAALLAAIKKLPT